ncbi:hypothetical protein [Marinobacterium litorale]|uniref:hypothetical protein n=1 Tax=Marinobacterium litorale TaxID=404770 RepID=UPI000407B8BD|nr:hypothetical protein [Marinobacterium litorale]
MKLLPALPLLLMTSSAWAGVELKTDIKYTDGTSHSVIDFDDGEFDKREYERKSRWESETLLDLGLTPDENWQWSARLGYNLRRTLDRKRNYREDDSLKKDKTRTEWRQYPFVGVGLRRDWDSALGGYGWSLHLSHDRYLDVAYKATELADDAKPVAGRGEGFQTKISLQAEYGTPLYSLYLLPRLSFKHEQFSAWTDTAQQDSEKAEQELQYEAQLWISWITPVPGWELSTGPTWQLEQKADRHPGDPWEWEDEEQWIGTLRLEYESPAPGFELELQAEHWLNGADSRNMRYGLELSYEF